MGSEKPVYSLGKATIRQSRTQCTITNEAISVNYECFASIEERSTFSFVCHDKTDVQNTKNAPYTSKVGGSGLMIYQRQASGSPLVDPLKHYPTGIS